MKSILNYIGQLRLYSLVDLILLLVVIGSDQYELGGAILLHLGFLAYLESKHAHDNRLKVPKSIAYVFFIIGGMVYGKFEAVVYILFSYLYTKKTKATGAFSPVLRGLQSLFLVAGIIGYHAPLLYTISFVFFVRNLFGDLRDVEKDRREGMRTIPILLRVKKSIPYVHFFATIASSVIWWSISSLSPIWLIVVILTQVGTYRLTPR